jgi:hypothetical protein
MGEIAEPLMILFKAAKLKRLSDPYGQRPTPAGVKLVNNRE